jgi:hypothetical protein
VARLVPAHQPTGRQLRRPIVQWFAIIVGRAPAMPKSAITLWPDDFSNPTMSSLTFAKIETRSLSRRHPRAPPQRRLQRCSVGETLVAVAYGDLGDEAQVRIGTRITPG